MTAETAKGLNTLPSKYAVSIIPPQKPRAQMSRRLPLSSPSLFVTDEIGGSMATSGHISVKMFAKRSLISLCLIVGNPPVGQIKACDVSNEAPQQHALGSLSGLHPYRMHRESRNSVLDRLNPCSLTGKASSHVDAPFSRAKSVLRWRDVGRRSRSAAAA